MTNKKITKRDRFNALLSIPAVQADAGLVDFINHELELLAKKNSADKKPTAQQEANAVIKTAVLATLADGKKRTVTDLLKDVAGLPEDMTNQRMSALVRQMVEAGQVMREEIKRKAHFFIAA